MEGVHIFRQRRGPHHAFMVLARTLGIEFASADTAGHSNAFLEKFSSVTVVSFIVCITAPIDSAYFLVLI